VLCGACAFVYSGALPTRGALVCTGVALTVLVNICAGVLYAAVAGGIRSAEYCGAENLSVFLVTDVPE